MLDDRGVYGVVGLDRPTTMLEVLETARDVSAADTSFVWGSEQMIHGLGEEAARWFPMWGPHMPSHHTYDATRALRAGPQRRSLAETVTDTLAWDRRRGTPELRYAGFPVGLPPKRERELLARLS